MSVKDKLAGCLYGYAIGNALGLGTEFMTRPEIAYRYPGGLRNYSQIIRDGHRSRWTKGLYTNDTELLLMLIDSLTECRKPDNIDFCRRFADWFKEEKRCDLESHLRYVISEPGFLEDPTTSTERVYQRLNMPYGPNECIGRAMLMGLMPHRNLETQVRQHVRSTHADSRCEAASMVIALMAHELLWHDTEAEYDLLLGTLHRIDPRAIIFLEMARDGRLEDFDLDDEETCTRIFKTTGAALWAFWHCESAEEALLSLVDEGGDADTNAALAMGLFGLREGMQCLPAPYLDTLLGKEKLELALSALTPYIESLMADNNTSHNRH